MEPKTRKVFEAITIGPQNLNQEILRMKSLEEFIKLKPPVFKGGSDPSEADTWLYSIKTIFDRIEVLPKYRVGFAAFLLEGAAEKWWDQNWSGKKVVGIAWKGFVELLRSEFSCVSPDWNTKIGFRDLVQTNSIAEYRARFEVLSCCDPTMETDPASKCAKFTSGLKPGIRAHISPFSIANFEELVDVALGVEADLNEDRFLGNDSGDLKTCECPARQRSGMTVEQYCAEFTEEHRPSDDGNKKADRVLMCIRFRCGLSPGIKSTMNRSPPTFNDFDTLVEAAKRAEATIIVEKKMGKEQKRKKEKEKQKQQQMETRRLENEKKLLEKKQQMETKRLENEKKLLEKQKQKEEKRKEQEEKERQIQETKKQRKEEKQKRHLERIKQAQEVKKRKQQLAIKANTGLNWMNKKAKFI